MYTHLLSEILHDLIDAMLIKVGIIGANCPVFDGYRDGINIKILVHVLNVFLELHL
jgi:hypothetical protein